MSMTIKHELDPVFETLCLLAMCHRQKDWKEELIEQLENYIPNGEAFFKDHFPIVEKYLEEFQKHKTQMEQEDFFFEDISHDTFLLITALAVENRSAMLTGALPDRQTLRSFLAFYITDTTEQAQLPDVKNMPQLPDEKSIIDFLSKTEIPQKDRWAVLNLLLKPDNWMGMLADIIQKNLPAYEKARSAVAQPLTRLMKRAAAYQDTKFLKIADTCTFQSVIYLSLASPLMQLVLYTCGYQGVLNEYLEISRLSPEFSRETVMRLSKSLCEKSKLDILCELKASSKYNLELAEALNLSPSTTSYHMGALLNSGLVTVEKKEGRVYYCLNRESISELLNNLEKLLL